MGEIVLRVLGQNIPVTCRPDEEARLKDLAAALEARVAEADVATPEGVKRLIVAALGLMDEAQASGAALVRARHEIERLNDLLAEAEAAPPLAHQL